MAAPSHNSTTLAAAPSSGFDLLLQYLDGFRLSKTLFAACSLGVFDALERHASPEYAELDDVARDLDVSIDGLKRLLDTLTAMGLVHKASSEKKKSPGKKKYGGGGGDDDDEEAVVHTKGENPSLSSRSSSTSSSSSSSSSLSPLSSSSSSFRRFQPHHYYRREEWQQHDPQRPLRQHFYRNAKVSREYLLEQSPNSCLGYVQHSDKLLFPMWGDLEGAVREGTNRWVSVFGSSSADAFSNYYKDPDQLMQFLRGMHSFGTVVSPIIVTAFDLTRYHHLVDVGGATGHVAQAACLQYPHLKATVFDLPAVLGAGASLIYGNKSIDSYRIDTVAGDFFDVGSLPPGDIYVLSRILHDWDDDKAVVILQNVYAAMPQHGACLICDMILNDEGDDDSSSSEGAATTTPPPPPAPATTTFGPLRTLLQSLNMLVQTEGRERTESEFRELLRRAGFSSVDFVRTSTYLDAILAIKTEGEEEGHLRRRLSLGGPL